jgi:hypothetical protein
MRKCGFFKFFLAFLCLAAAGCTTVRVPNYIQDNHPYVQKIYGDYGKISAVVRDVLVKNGWKVQSETNPSVYERPEAGSSGENDILLFTNIKQHSRILYSSYAHLNVFIHPIAEGAEVEIRYQKVTPLLIKQVKRTRNDKLGQKLLHQIEMAMLEDK